MLFTFGEMVAYRSWVLFIHAKVDAGAKAKHEVSDPLGFLGCRPPSEIRVLYTPLGLPRYQSSEILGLHATQ